MPGRVLIVDDVATNRLVLKARLSANYFDAVTASDGLAALEVLRKESIDVVLLDVKMPGMDGYDVCKAIKSDPQFAHIPVVMVTATNTIEEKIRGLDAGADDFLSKNIAGCVLVARIQNLVRVKIMLDELRLRDTVFRDLGVQPSPTCDKLLGTAGCKVLFSPGCGIGPSAQSYLGMNIPVALEFCKTMPDFFRRLDTDAPDGVVIAHKLPDGCDGLRVVSQIRATLNTRQSSIMLIVEKHTLDIGSKALEIGANDYIQAPFDAAELLARLRVHLKRKKYSDILRMDTADKLRMALRDALTGVYNRSYAIQHLEQTLRQSRASDKPFTVMMLDLDKFKRINDTYGHPAGDAVLIEFTQRLQNNLRSMDMVSRLGGEEFLVVLPEMSAADADVTAERLRAATCRMPVRLPSGKEITMTVSIGALHCTPGCGTTESILSSADAVLYQAKETGRNKVIAALLAA